MLMFAIGVAFTVAFSISVDNRPTSADEKNPQTNRSMTLAEVTIYVQTSLAAIGSRYNDLILIIRLLKLTAI